MKHDILVEMKNVSKFFPGVVANDKVNVSFHAGEIHALLGENGAGKSTLMSILTGLYQPDEGEIFLRGKKVTFRSPKDAISAGVGIVHQHFKLISSFTVEENLVLTENSPWKLQLKEMRSKISELQNEFGLKIDFSSRIWQLSVGEQQKVEILKMLVRGSDVLILDEPTAVLTPQETQELFATLKYMAAKGKAVIIITHKMHEVMQVADRITVLRGGKSVHHTLKNATNETTLTKMMVGKEVILHQTKLTRQSFGDNILCLNNVSALNDKGLVGLNNLSLNIRAGEILGIAGVAGNGQKELAEVISGIRNTTSGEITVCSTTLTGSKPKDYIASGVSLIPEDRLGMGLVPALDAIDNCLLKNYRSKEWGSLLLKPKKVAENAAHLVNKFDVKIPSLKVPVRMMSGGNLQRLLLAREISGQPKLIVAVYPVRGLDIKATDDVHQLLLKQRAAGCAILLISEELEELLAMSDRIAVLYNGEIVGTLSQEEATPEKLGLLMTGQRKEASA